jgi:hypothetical protein
LTMLDCVRIRGLAALRAHIHTHPDHRHLDSSVSGGDVGCRQQEFSCIRALACER